MEIRPPISSASCFSFAGTNAGPPGLRNTRTCCLGGPGVTALRKGLNQLVPNRRAFEAQASQF